MRCVKKHVTIGKCADIFGVKFGAGAKSANDAKFTRQVATRFRRKISVQLQTFDAGCLGQGANFAGTAVNEYAAAYSLTAVPAKFAPWPRQPASNVCNCTEIFRLKRVATWRVNFASFALFAPAPNFTPKMSAHFPIVTCFLTHLMRNCAAGRD